MSADLQQIGLSDIFQTLAMSKMEGLLRVRNALEQRVLYFRDAQVQDLYLGRPENQRIGERLLRAGLIKPNQLEAALRRNRETRKPIGMILVEDGAVDQNELDDLLHYQAAEDLYALFTWKHGSFEFFKGNPSDVDVLQRSELVPRFDVSSALLEVARRADEWSVIVESLHSMDEIPIPSDPGETRELDEDHQLVLGAIDGNGSIRELAETTLLGLFTTARAIRNLHEWGYVQLPRPDELLAIAEMQRLRGDTKRAVLTLRTLIDREESLDIETTRELAAALDHCGEPRLGGHCLWRAAVECEQPLLALDLAREACRLDKRSSHVLEHLIELLKRNGVDGQEVIDATSDLADALAEEGNQEGALNAIQQLETLSNDVISIASRKARLLQKLDRTPDAIVELERLAEHLKRQQRRDQLATVYEQILMLDYRRRDIARELRALRTSKRVRYAAAGTIAATLLAAGSMGYVYFRNLLGIERLSSTVSTLQERLDAGELDGTAALLDAATQEFGECPELEDIATRLRRALRQANIARQRASGERPTDDLALAADCLERGDLVTSLDIYGRLLASHPSPPADSQPGGPDETPAEIPASEVEETLAAARTRLTSFGPRLARLADELPRSIPDPASEQHSTAQRQTALSNLKRAFLPADLQVAQGVLGARNSEILVQLIGRTETERLVADAVKVDLLFAQAKELARQYTDAQQRADAKQRLEPVFLLARQHEQNNNFEEAAEAYRQLVEQYPIDNELKAEFAVKRKRFESILTALRRTQKATASGDYAAAVQGLRGLRESYPDIPFDQIVRLPLHVETLPHGATVKVNGIVQGVTPLLTTYAPTGRTRVSVELEGFQPHETSFTGDSHGSLNALLVRRPDWTNMVRGSVQRAPVCDPQGRAFIVDREGSVTALELATGDVLWFHATGDLSGLLPTPVVFGSILIVASFDGRLRTFDRASGQPGWQSEGLRCEGAPALLGDTLVVGTVDARVVALDAANGAERFRLPLPGPAHADVVSLGRVAYLTTTNGHVVAVHAQRAVELWSKRVGARIAAAVAATPEAVFAASDDGVLAALATKDGSVLWSHQELGELVLTPCVVDGRVVVATGNRLNSFDVADGKPGPGFEGPHDWSTPPVLTTGKLFCGNRMGVLMVLDPGTLELRYQLRGEGPITAAPAIGPSGRVLAAFEDRIVQGFFGLP